MTIINQLLFFDTFSHESCDTIRLDLVQFPRAVQVSEIRVIPLGARVHADFPGGVRLGATNPSVFEIEFFINDLSKRGAATFENVGKLQYSQNRNIHIEIDKKPPTDGLLLRGNYNTITLAVYGSLTKVQRDSTPPKSEMRSDIVPQPPPEKVNTHERIRHWLEDTKRKQHVYEINPSEEEPPDWDGKVSSLKTQLQNRRSPVDFEATKTWEGRPENAPQDVEKEKKSYKRSQSREKSWDRAEQLTKKENKKERQSDRNSSQESHDLTTEKDKLIKSSQNKEHVEDDDTRSRGRKRSIDDWEEKQSDDLTSLRRPRTPLEPTDPPSDSHSISFAKEEDKTLDTSRGSNALPLPILSDDMEAISDDEVLPDLPPPETTEFRDTVIEDEEADPPTNDEAPISATEENDLFEYDQIMSDEDDLPEYQYEEDFIIEEWEDWAKPFNAQDIQELPRIYFYSNPSTTEYEREFNYWKNYGSKLDSYDEKVALGCKLLGIVNETALPVFLESKNSLGEVITEENGEVWVQAVEQVCQLLPSALIYVEDSKDILKKLSEWAECGLDIDMALNQEQPVFKIRHMKAGIRLTSILVQISYSLATRSIIEKLFRMNEQSHLALSIKLQIFRTLDLITSSAAGLYSFAYDRTGDTKTGYEIILELLSTNQQSRAKMALSAIIRKIHLFEICEKLNADVFSLVNIVGNDDDNKLGEENYSSCQNDNKLDVEIKGEKLSEVSHGPYVPPELLNSIDSCLKEIVRMFLSADQLLVQPNRCLPGSKLFQIPKHNQNPLQHVFIIFEMTKVLESIIVLLATPFLNQSLSLCHHVKAFIRMIIDNEQGIRFLAWQPKATLMLIKSLFQNVEDIREGQSYNMKFYQLGAQLGGMMHIVHQLDSLAILQENETIKKKKNSDELVSCELSQAVIHLHALETLSMSFMGKEAIVNVLGMPPFFQTVIPYLKEDDQDSNPLKIACFGYAVNLLTVVLKFQNDAIFIESYAEKIHSLIPSEAPTDGLKVEETVKLLELQSWVSIAKDSDMFSYDKLTNLTVIVQENIDKLERFPGELFTALRILTHLTISKVSAEQLASPNNEMIEELKYKYATMQLFSADLHTHIISMLSKLFVIYQQPFLHSSNFAGDEGALIVMLLKPALALLKNILDKVIQVRKTDFKDLTAIIPLVQTYILLQAFPCSSQYSGAAYEMQQTVINVLLSYTQVVYTTEGEGVLSKSLWTQMMAEIFKYLMNAPHTMVYVINLITELLPLPLPIETITPLSKEENTHAIRVRKLWSAHLYSLAPTFQEITHRLGLATNPLLTHSLRRMCVALSDLSAPMSLLVAKATLDLVFQTHRLDQRAIIKEDTVKIKDDLSKISTIQASQQTSRALNMLASLVSHAPTKAAVLHLLRGGSTTLTHTPSKSEEKYTALVQTWCSILCMPCKAAAHMVAQESLVIIIEYLVDYENAMQVQQSNDENISLMGIPPKEILLPFIEALVEVIRSSTSTTFIICQCLQILSKLTDHNFCFYYVKSVLDARKGTLHCVLQTLTNEFCKEVCQDSVYLLQELLYFSQLLITSWEQKRSLISVLELASYFNWKADVSQNHKPSSLLVNVVEKEESANNDDMILLKEELTKKEDSSTLIIVEKNHLLRKLEKLVLSEIGEEELMESLYEDISQLISLFESETGPSTEIIEDEEPIPVGLESIQGLFANRIVCTYPTWDDINSFWLSSPSVDELKQQDMVAVNLMETSRKYANEFDLSVSLQKLVKGQVAQVASPQKTTKVSPNKYKQSTTAIRPDKRGKPYVAPMRGRPFGRALNIRSDPFRSRPPNTSRPPSLHVDDFVALESTGHQPTGPTGYNKISFGRGKMMLDSIRGNNRGRTRGDSRGSRFFHRPPFRGEAGGRGQGRSSGQRRGSGWVFRGDSAQRGNSRGNSQMQSRFLRGSPFSRGSNNNSKDRFSQKFERGRGERGRHMRGDFR